MAANKQTLATRTRSVYVIFVLNDSGMSLTCSSPLPRTENKATRMHDDHAATVTVKFLINAEEMFTKAFRNSDTIDDIKVQLAFFFSVDSARIRLSHGEQTLSNSLRLAELGVEALGTIDLSVSTDRPLVLNRDRIYGHIPTVDVINVRGRSGSQHVVEIEYQRLEKEWLGGYRHTLTKKEYHHASTQTPPLFDRNPLLQVSKSVQIHLGNEKSTSTAVDKVVQTTIVPSTRDKFLFPRPRPQIRDDQFGQAATVKEPKPGMRKLYQQIAKWNRSQSERVASLEESPHQKQVRRFEILDLTRKLLMRADRHRMKRARASRARTIQQILSQVGSPKVVVSRTGERISVDTVEAQWARRLKLLYLDFRQQSEIAAKRKVVLELQDFFSRAEYECGADILQLLQTESNLLAKGLVGTANLETRIEQFILYVFKQLAGERAAVVREPRFPRGVDLDPYRDILIRLQDDEVKVFKCFSSGSFRMQVAQMYRLVHEIWADCSIKSESRDLNALRMTRWRKEDEWSVINCLLLTKYEVKEHLKAEITTYEKCFVSKVKNNHFRAQLLFCGDPLFDEDTKFVK